MCSAASKWGQPRPWSLPPTTRGRPPTQVPVFLLQPGSASAGGGPRGKAAPWGQCRTDSLSRARLPLLHPGQADGPWMCGPGVPGDRACLGEVASLMAEGPPVRICIITASPLSAAHRSTPAQSGGEDALTTAPGGPLCGTCSQGQLPAAHWGPVPGPGTRLRGAGAHGGLGPGQERGPGSQGDRGRKGSTDLQAREGMRTQPDGEALETGARLERPGRRQLEKGGGRELSLNPSAAPGGGSHSPRKWQ